MSFLCYLYLYRGSCHICLICVCIGAHVAFVLFCIYNGAHVAFVLFVFVGAHVAFVLLVFA
jgi:hypothetical protein